MERHGDAKLTDLLQTLASCPKPNSVSIHDRLQGDVRAAAAVSDPSARQSPPLRRLPTAA
jgi:hypothetical protein